MPPLLLREESEQVSHRGVPLAAGQPLVKDSRMRFVGQGDLQDLDFVQVQHRERRSLRQAGFFFP